MGPLDRFCAKCGAQQPAGPSQEAGGAGSTHGDPHAHQFGDFWNTMPDRTTMLLCYLPWVGWIAGVGVLASPRFRTNNRVRFHAFQSLYLFVAWLLVEWVVSPMARVPDAAVGSIAGLLHLMLLIAWIVMMVKVNQNEDYRLPIIGDLAQKSVDEQSL